MITLKPVAYVRGGRQAATNDDWDSVEAEIVLDESRLTAESLMGLGDFSHVEVDHGGILGGWISMAGEAPVEIKIGQLFEALGSPHSAPWRTCNPRRPRRPNTIFTASSASRSA